MKPPVLSIVMTLALAASPAVALAQVSEPPRQESQATHAPAKPAPAEAPRVQEWPSGLGDALRTIGQDFVSFPTTRTLAWVGAGAGLAVVGVAGDRALVRDLGGKRWPGFRAGASIGSGPAHLGLALGTFAAGRLSGSGEISALGFQLIRANLMTQAITHGLKFTTHRIRPDGTGLSFPSGHSATTFAAATVVQRRYGWKAGVPAYALASYVAASRVNDRRHYASDVIFGAGLGIAVGLTVTRDHPGAGSFVPVITRGGVSAVWTKTW